MIPHINDGGSIVVVGSRGGSLPRIPSEENRAKLMSDTLTLEQLVALEQSYQKAMVDKALEAAGWQNSQYGLSKAFFHSWVRITARDETHRAWYSYQRTLPRLY